MLAYSNLGSVTLKLCEKIATENLEMSTNEMSNVRDGSIGICGEQLVGFERLLDCSRNENPCYIIDYD